MYEFWYALGAMVMDSGYGGTLLKDITNEKPVNCVTQLASRQLVEVDKQGKVSTLNCNSMTAVTLNNPRGGPYYVDIFRAAVAKDIRKAGAAGKLPPFAPPPVSIYAAGRIAQLLAISSVGFGAILTSAISAFGDALANSSNPNPTDFSGAFPAAIGLCLLDAALVGHIPTVDTTMDPQDDAQMKTFVQEFGLSSKWTADRLVLSYFVNSESFPKAAKLLQNGNFAGQVVSTPWQDICGDQYMYWTDQNDRAVI